MGGLGGLEVTCLCYKRKYTVCDVTRKSASIPCFMPKLWSIVYVYRFPIDNKENTVREYIQETYNIQLMCPHLPCLHVGKNVYVFTVYVHSSVSTTAFYKEQKVIELMCVTTCSWTQKKTCSDSKFNYP